MVCQKWIYLTLHWLNFRSVSEILSYEPSMSLWAYWPSHLSTSIISESIQEVRVCMLEYFLQRCCPKDCTRNPLQRTNLLHIRLKLRDLNYQTPFYVDYILKYQENCRKIHFSVDNSWNFEVISKSSILKQIYKGEK
jgi:hypothetical protein